jgi:hypothetical protein
MRGSGKRGSTKGSPCGSRYVLFIDWLLGEGTARSNPPPAALTVQGAQQAPLGAADSHAGEYEAEPGRREQLGMTGPLRIGATGGSPPRIAIECEPGGVIVNSRIDFSVWTGAESGVP